METRMFWLILPVYDQAYSTIIRIPDLNINIEKCDSPSDAIKISHWFW